MDIWAECKEAFRPVKIIGEIIRVVESQEQIATNEIVDGLAEQETLEHMLEQTKPHPVAGSESLHYLLSTPFRYPPLPYGSRFGARTEPSLFYGSLTLATALAETGYYRFLFWSGMTTPPASGKYTTQHTIFRASYHTLLGAQLQNPPFNKYQSYLTDPAQYNSTQQLGTALREEEVEGIEYVSARDPDNGINVALFVPAALYATKPFDQELWLSEITANEVNFYASSHTSTMTFPIETYLIDNRLPTPAV